MPSCPMAMPSSTAIVLNSLATPPAFSISRATSWPRSWRWTWPGTNCVKEFTTAMIGLPKSPSFMPVARHRPRAPAMLRPWVEVADLSLGIALRLRSRAPDVPLRGTLNAPRPAAKLNSSISMIGRAHGGHPALPTGQMVSELA
ncbi:hypothetical protein BOSEA31B_11795 [Hyphomicrobiales bacterium]|nr:hypothetical protein BOSEA31B_11795 [Hyphomicrobiales bacterium]CAI0347221.1 hypothetical protein BO1005MUT1_70002 [Hyphomicrobiales bacterium]